MRSNGVIRHSVGFLESLNVHEGGAVRLLLYPVICPVFLSVGDARRPGGVAKPRPTPRKMSLARSLVSRHRYTAGRIPSIARSVVSNLMGQDVPMRGQIVVSHGIPVVVAGERRVVYSSRHRNERLLIAGNAANSSQVERLHARQWRKNCAHSI